MGFHDPWRLRYRPGPEPVEGELPPPIRLVEDEDLLHGPAHPRWVRWSAAALSAGFLLALGLTALAHGARSSLLIPKPVFAGGR